MGTVLPLIIVPIMTNVKQRQAERKARLEQPFHEQMNAYTRQFGTSANPALPCKAKFW